jgi:HEAT repeat protein
MRFEAARACGELELHEAIPKLAMLAEDEDIEVRQAALWALGRIGGPEARRILLTHIESDVEVIREAAEEALEELTFAEDALRFPVYELHDDNGDEDDMAFWDFMEDDLEDEW